MIIQIECDQCFKINTECTNYIPDYSGTILKSFWCRYCDNPQVIRFKIIDECNIEITERLLPSSVYVPHKPDAGITIRPKVSKRKG